MIVKNNSKQFFTQKELNDFEGYVWDNYNKYDGLIPIADEKQIKTAISTFFRKFSIDTIALDLFDIERVGNILKGKLKP